MIHADRVEVAAELLLSNLAVIVSVNFLEYPVSLLGLLRAVSNPHHIRDCFIHDVAMSVGVSLHLE